MKVRCICDIGKVDSEKIKNFLKGVDKRLNFQIISELNRDERDDVFLVENSNSKICLICCSRTFFEWKTIFSSEVKHDKSNDSIRILVKHLIKTNYKFNRIIAHKSICDIFIPEVSKLTNNHSIIKKEMEMPFFYVNKKLLEPPKKKLEGFDSYITRLSNSEDVTSLLQLFKEKEYLDVFYHGLDQEKVIKSMESKIKSIITKKSLFVLHKKGEKTIISSLSIKSIKEGIKIGGVYTSIKYRKKGFASWNVYLCCKKFLEQMNKDFVCLYTDKKNETSNSIYKAIGFTRISLTQNFQISLKN